MHRMKDLVGVAAVMALVVVSACGKSSSPTSPSPSSSGNTGAVINGIVSGMAGGSGAAGFAKLDTGTGITVTINGTNVIVPVDASGKFVFTGVPAGTVQLVITVGGVPTTITLEGVKETDKIVVKITVKGTTAALDTEERNGMEVTELEDRIAVIDKTARTLVVGAVKVSVPATAVIRQGNDTKVDFATLNVGDRVHVRGTMSGDVFTATEVKVQNTNQNVAVNASGKLAAAATGTCPDLAFVVGGWNVVTNGGTDFGKDGCKPLAAGASVHVKGDVQQSTGKVLATWVQIK